jgi:metal-responsive CopG/Arc/MetJ family transcriptional regulator
MAKSIRVITKSRGRPKTTGTGTLIGVRLQDEALKRVDTWASNEKDKPSRPEAIRRLVETGLKRTR